MLLRAVVPCALMILSVMPMGPYLDVGMCGKGWSSPEVLRGERSGPPADVYSYGVCGCCAWVCACVSVPLGGADPP